MDTGSGLDGTLARGNELSVVAETAGRDGEGLRHVSVDAVDEPLGAVVEDGLAGGVDAENAAEEALVVGAKNALSSRDHVVAQTVERVGDGTRRGGLVVLAGDVVLGADAGLLVAFRVRAADSRPVAVVVDGLAGRVALVDEGALVAFHPRRG